MAVCVATSFEARCELSKGANTVPDRPSLLDELRTQYEAARKSTHEHADVESFQAIDTRLRKAFRWLEKAITYLDELKPAIDHRFDLGHGFAFESPRFGHGFVGQHERRIVGFPVLDEINVYYEISASKPLALEIAPEGVALAEKALDEAGLQYTSRRVEDSSGTVRKCAISLLNVDRIDRVTLEFHSNAIEEPVLEDLVRLILGRDSAFLRRAPLAGLHKSPSA